MAGWNILALLAVSRYQNCPSYFSDPLSMLKTASCCTGGARNTHQPTGFDGVPRSVQAMVQAIAGFDRKQAETGLWVVF